MRSGLCFFSKRFGLRISGLKIWQGFSPTCLHPRNNQRFLLFDMLSFLKTPLKRSAIHRQTNEIKPKIIPAHKINPNIRPSMCPMFFTSLSFSKYTNFDWTKQVSTYNFNYAFNISGNCNAVIQEISQNIVVLQDRVEETKGVFSKFGDFLIKFNQGVQWISNLSSAFKETLAPGAALNWIL